MDEQDIYAAIGEAGFGRLTRAFYAKVPTDEILGPMYPALDLGGAELRLRDFLVGRFGGPPRYMLERGHPRLRARHAPFPIGQAARNRWVTLMGQALVEAELPDEAVRVLGTFFEATATFLLNRQGGAGG